MAIWRMRVACWIPKATSTHSEYVILITFPLQQWLQEDVPMLRLRALTVLSMLGSKGNYRENATSLWERLKYLR